MWATVSGLLEPVKPNGAVASWLRPARPNEALTHLEVLMAITAFLTSPETPIPFPHEQPDARRSWLMLHARLITPSESTPKVLQFLEASSAVTHLCINEQSARKPAGDVVSFDVAREGATSVLEALRGIGLEHKGAIVVENLDISISESAIRAEEETRVNQLMRWCGSSLNKAQAKKHGSPSPTSVS
jgi:hypothetical protein